MIACVIPVHRRVQMALETILMLKRQTVPVTVILIGDTEIEARMAEDTGSEYVQYPNQPLTSKWQAGVWRAGDLNPDAILTMGSDTWLTPTWCEVALGYLDKFDVVGKDRWYICKLSRRRLDLMEVGHKEARTGDPGGLGRLFSREAMRKMGWVLFPERKGSRADGIALRQARACGCTVGVMNDAKIAAVTLKCDQWSTLHTWGQLRGNPGLEHFQDVQHPARWLAARYPGSGAAIKRLRSATWPVRGQRKDE